VKRLVENGVSANAHDYDQRTGLHLAASEGRTEVVQYLLELRADASLEDRFGGSALDDAIRHGHAGIQRLLYDAGARVSGMSNVLRACAASARCDPRDIEVTKNLVDNGLDPNVGDYDGRTPLHLAACSGKLGLLEYLLSVIQSGSRSGRDSALEAGGKQTSHLNVVDRFGFTPLDDAFRHGNNAAVVLLEKAGTMRRGDPLLAKFVEARQRRQTEQRRERMRSAAAEYLKLSPEVKAWGYIHGTALPAMRAVLEQLLDSNRAAEKLACRVLPAIRNILELYVRHELPSQVAMVKAKLTGRRFHTRDIRTDLASPAEPAGDAAVLRGAYRGSLQRYVTPAESLRKQLLHQGENSGDAGRDAGRMPSQSPSLRASALPTRAELEKDMDALIRQVGEFLARDCAAARDVLGVDFSQLGAIRLASKGLVLELTRLSGQVLRNAGILKLIRRILKDVYTLCLSRQGPR
jgi:hypothetical protein